MPDIRVDEAEADRILDLPKRIRENNQWKQGDDRNWFMEVPVEASEQMSLRLYGRYNPRTGNYTFILFHGRTNLRRLDVGKIHHNPECDNVGAVHKHRWTDRYHDKWAYVPSDVDSSALLDGVFRAFLSECRTELEARFVNPPGYGQRRLI
ncbi:MAG: hypothetical protein FJY85_03340 [Deltaproteobacteria bacterium]|nr:hypothetical protein [Deltaproteobacteria bacterium]